MGSPRLYRTLRSFPVYQKNCYTLAPAVEGQRYLVRAYFMYGNYDGRNVLPIFDVYLGVDFWSTVRLDNASHVFWTEITTKATTTSINVCLVKTADGIPFISGLEVRPLDDILYADANNSTYLITYKRINAGTTEEASISSIHKYEPFSFIRSNSDDDYDTYGSPVSTNITISSGQGFKLPSYVWRTAENSSTPMFISWSGETNVQFHIFLYFAEVVKHEKNQTRIIFVELNGGPFFRPFRLEYDGGSMTVYTINLKYTDEYKFTIRAMDNSTFGPIINAFEVYKAYDVSGIATYSEDVDAIFRVKAHHQLRRNWGGDPCLPKNITWVGLNCKYNSSRTPRIDLCNATNCLLKYPNDETILYCRDLSNSGLNGTISTDLCKLTLISYINLSRSNLHGSIPECLATLTSLTVLDLSNNDLSGSVPDALQEKKKEELIDLRLDNNPHLCQWGSSEGKKKFPLALVISIPIAVVVVLVTFGVLIYKCRKRKPGNIERTEASVPQQLGTSGPSPALEKRHAFTYAEVVAMTKNFAQVIGRGGSGIVYYGCLENGCKVAVKKLNKRFFHGDKQFAAEVKLLMTVHHRHLVSFIGYCTEADNMILICEYMSNGNLQELLSGKGDLSATSSMMSWRRRLQIAVNAATGLEYLHSGCRTTIIHRDVKTTNILLNEKLEAKLADFGLCRSESLDGNTHISTAVAGTPGYVDPEYFSTSMLTIKSDIYSFGVVLLEIISARSAISTLSGHRVHIVDWAKCLLSEGNVSAMIDCRLEVHLNIYSLLKVVDLAILCTSEKGVMRPTMADVVQQLKEALEMETSSQETVTPEMTSSATESSVHCLPPR
ncbi:probable leucine-rich repeat receptor-like protein kinase At2g28990 [Nymphaea colorata]|nr:probable leucine-rich repeat receptor-like protein kinase At2g28990 [Nymphaea colorata]